MFFAGKSARPSGRTDRLKQTSVKRRKEGFINLRNLHATKIPDIITRCIHADCARDIQLSARSGHRRKTAYNPPGLGFSLHSKSVKQVNKNMNFQMCKRAVKTSYAKAGGQVITDLPEYLIMYARKQVCLALHREVGINARKNAHRKLYASVPTQMRNSIPTQQRTDTFTCTSVYASIGIPDYTIT